MCGLFRGVEALDGSSGIVGGKENHACFGTVPERGGVEDAAGRLVNELALDANGNHGKTGNAEGDSRDGEEANLFGIRGLDRSAQDDLRRSFGYTDAKNCRRGIVSERNMAGGEGGA